MKVETSDTSHAGSYTIILKSTVSSFSAIFAISLTVSECTVTELISENFLEEVNYYIFDAEIMLQYYDVYPSPECDGVTIEYNLMVDGSLVLPDFIDYYKDL